MTELTNSVLVEFTKTGELRLVEYDAEPETGARYVRDIVEGDYRTIMGELLTRLNPDPYDPKSQLVLRKKPKSRAELREERRQNDRAVTKRAMELSGFDYKNDERKYSP